MKIKFCRDLPIKAEPIVERLWGVGRVYDLLYGGKNK